MPTLFQKLNFKSHPAIHVCNAPASFEAALDEVRALTTIHSKLPKKGPIQFALTFATKQSEVDAFAQSMAHLAEGDAIVWVAYPKGTSKKFKCEFNRDNGFAKLGEAGFEPVRMVAIDEDWSALRFRRVEHIKTMTRSTALTNQGKKRIAAKRA
jgi:hypothetical protein